MRDTSTNIVKVILSSCSEEEIKNPKNDDINHETNEQQMFSMENMTEFDVPEEKALAPDYSGVLTQETVRVEVREGDDDENIIVGAIFVEYSNSENKVSTIAYSDDLVDFFDMESELNVLMEDGSGDLHDDFVDMDDFGDEGQGLISFLKKVFVGVEYKNCTQYPNTCCCIGGFDHWFIGVHSVEDKGCGHDC